MSSPDLSRFNQFLAIPVEDIAGRANIGLTESDSDELHDLAVDGKVPWELYHQVTTAQKADFIYRKEGQGLGWTIAFIREQLGRTVYRHYTWNGEDVHEWVSGRVWPKGIFIERIRSRQDPVTLLREIEWALAPKANLDSFWGRCKPEMEKEGIRLLQRFPDNQLVQDICLLASRNLSARMLVSAGRRRKELVFPIALRYEPLLRKFAKTHTLDITEPEAREISRQPLHRASTEELQEAITGLWKAVQDYDESKGIPVPAYIKKQLVWHMGAEFKRRSTEVRDSGTGKHRRVLKAVMDRTGGSLDDLLPSEDGSEARTVGESLADPDAGPPDQRILLQQIQDSLVDETDKKIVHLWLQGVPQREIAKKLEMTQPAISKRLMRLGKNLGH